MLRLEKNTYNMDAFEFAHSIRYLDDTKLRTVTADHQTMQNYEAGLALNSLKISNEITPDIYKSLEETCSSLNLQIDKVRAYVTSSSELQAGCMSFDKKSCIITMTSEIINLMSFEEIKFVMGHELGHFLFSHNIEEMQVIASKEGYIKKRAQEISVDRIGLWACGDMNIATRAIIKSLSGLDERYLIFNMQSFLSQLDDEKVKNEESSQFSTHPSFILRAKALLRFSSSDPYQQYINKTSGMNLLEVDKLIQEDLNTYIDKDLRQDIRAAHQNIAFWGYAYAFVKTGSLSRENQMIIKNKFTNEMNEKLKNMIKDQPTEVAINNVKDKFFNSIDVYKKLAPNIASRELNLLLMEIEDAVKQKDFFKEIIRSI